MNECINSNSVGTNAVFNFCLKNKIKLIGDKPTIGAENHKVIFIHPRSTGGILVELAEKIN